MVVQSKSVELQSFWLHFYFSTAPSCSPTSLVIDIKQANLFKQKQDLPCKFLGSFSFYSILINLNTVFYFKMLKI